MLTPYLYATNARPKNLLILNVKSAKKSTAGHASNLNFRSHPESRDKEVATLSLMMKMGVIV